jgi:hypothetical protein
MINNQALRATVEIATDADDLYEVYRGVIYNDNGRKEHACRYKRQDYYAALDDAQCLLNEINYKQTQGEQQ